MTSVDLEPKKKRSIATSTFSPSIWHDVMGLDSRSWFFNISFYAAFSLSSLTLIKKFFSSSSLSAIRVVSSTYLRLLMFLLPILIPACNSSSLAFLMMCSAYRLNKYGGCRPVILLSQSWTHQLCSNCWLLDLHTGFSGDKEGGLVFPYL